jgi:pimeloyl-ACP methyl ester carboxylesterase
MTTEPTTERVARTFEDTDFGLDVVLTGADARGTALLLHGFPQDATLWDATLPGLHALGLRTAAVDQRGYSALPQPDSAAAYALPELVSDALAVLDHLGVEQAVVVGHDWGAVVAWALAAAHPHRVRALVAASVPHPRAYGAALKSDPEQQQRSAYLSLMREAGTAERVLLADDARRLTEFFRGTTSGPDVVARWVQRVREPARLSRALAWYRGMRGEDFAAVKAVSVPTVYVTADDDLAVGQAAVTGCADWVTGPYERVELTGSHWIVDDHPEAIVAAVARAVELTR